MNLADALKKLYLKLGGTDTLPQGTDTCTLVDKIADEVSGGGSSGGGTLYLTETDEGGGVFNLGASYNDIATAIANGSGVVVVAEEVYASSTTKRYTSLQSISVGYNEGVATSYVVAFGSREYTSETADGILKAESGPK